MTPFLSTDADLGRRLAEKEDQALVWLTEYFAGLLDTAFEEMKSETPGCRLSQGDLLPLVGCAVGRGFTETAAAAKSSLADFVPTLHLADLFWAAACLAKDAAAWQRFAQTARGKVCAGLQKLWADRAGVDTVRRIAADLPGHCLQEFAKGANAGLPRLAAFHGRASLSSWLFVAGVRLLQEELRQKQRHIAAEQVDRAAIAASEQQPENVLLHAEAGHEGNQLRRRLIETIKEALDAMPPRRRLAAVLHWIHGDRPSDIAAKMRVSRPRVTELLSEARDQIRKIAQTVCEEIAAASNRKVSDVQELLLAELGPLLR